MVYVARLSRLLGAGILLAPALFAQAADPGAATPLGVQTCDTQCQTTETDCDLACDQVVACVEECKKASAICADKCRDAPPPVKPDSSAKPSSPGAKKAPPGKGPAKAPPAKVPPKPKAI